MVRTFPIGRDATATTARPTATAVAFAATTAASVAALANAVANDVTPMRIVLRNFQHERSEGVTLWFHNNLCVRHKYLCAIGTSIAELGHRVHLNHFEGRKTCSFWP